MNIALISAALVAASVIPQPLDMKETDGIWELKPDAVIVLPLPLVSISGE